MNKITLGKTIAQLRKEQGLTQAELAEKMNVTDKAVSKWERDLSCPEISSLPKLAEIFSVSVDELMQLKKKEDKNTENIVPLIFKAVATAMGVATVVLSLLQKLELQSGFVILGIGLACTGMSMMSQKRE